MKSAFRSVAKVGHKVRKKVRKQVRNSFYRKYHGGFKIRPFSKAFAVHTINSNEVRNADAFLRFLAGNSPTMAAQNPNRAKNSGTIGIPLRTREKPNFLPLSSRANAGMSRLIPDTIYWRGTDKSF
ncbi:MAG: hypothetical protein IT472_08770 [Thermomonas sp.]|uniref:hypothetical protein n=1 Tax=Thermomonas sp. TaxID=1971895 RepID=UPI00262A39E8|nr:hypothetical protein [Thermomonas sp.]MCC7097257.1 hypothetical protein [Thermomonas sp.]